MNRFGFSTIGLVALGLLSITWLATPPGVAEEIELNDPSAAFTPRPGSPLRKAILDSLRQMLKRNWEVDAVFVVEHLMVKDGWAWMHTLPQSPDGRSHYEDLVVLMSLQDGVWEVIDGPCEGADEDPECFDDEFVRMKKRYPGVPAEIFPEASE